jgi:hypothetical protein
MKRRFEKGDVVVLKPDVRMPFRVPRKGIVRFVYDPEPPPAKLSFIGANGL